MESHQALPCFPSFHPLKCRRHWISDTHTSRLFSFILSIHLPSFCFSILKMVVRLQKDDLQRRPKCSRRYLILFPSFSTPFFLPSYSVFLSCPFLKLTIFCWVKQKNRFITISFFFIPLLFATSKHFLSILFFKFQ